MVSDYVKAENVTCFPFPHNAAKPNLTITVHELIHTCTTPNGTHLCPALWEYRDQGEDIKSTFTVTIPTFDANDNKTLIPLVMAITANVLYRYPSLFGFNVTNITLGANSICFHGGNYSLHRTDDFQFEIFKKHLTDANQLYILEWIRPLFTCWLVLSISYWLSGTTVGRV